MPNILVIDDEPFVREALERVLNSPVTSVTAVPDAAAGLQFLRDMPVDVVIIDVVMPGMDGATAIKEIRHAYPKVHIIAISGGGNFGLEAYRPESISTSAYLAACTEAGADRILPKPFETAELRALIAELLDHVPQGVLAQ